MGFNLNMKDKLAQLIETYAAAKATNNALLQQYSVQLLNDFLNNVEIIEKTQEENESIQGTD